MNKIYEDKNYTSKVHKLRRFITLLIVTAIMMGTIIFTYLDSGYIPNEVVVRYNNGAGESEDLLYTYSDSNVDKQLVALAISTPCRDSLML